ncbi:MAG TPA: hypothetical protein VNP72_07575 [Longimicrobium sp.]|nr:hypothetical protein [Longimicrobium sp.]
MTQDSSAASPLAVTVSVEDRHFGLWQAELFLARFRQIAPDPAVELVVLVSIGDGEASPYLRALEEVYPWAHFVRVPTRTGGVRPGRNFRVINKSASRRHLLDAEPRWRAYDLCVLDPDVLLLPPFLDGYLGAGAGTIRSERWRWMEPALLREAVACLAGRGAMEVADADAAVRDILERYALGYMFTLPAARAADFCRRWEEWTALLAQNTACGWMSDPYATVLAAFDLGLAVERRGYTMSSEWAATRVNPSVSILHYAWPNDFFYKKHFLEPGSGPFREASYPEQAYAEGSIGREMCRAFNEHVRARPDPLKPFV